MDIGSLDSFLFRYTESELRHRGEPPDVLSPRYRRIPQVNFAGRDMYLFSFNSLMEGRSICVNKESRFTFIPEHIHTVIEFLYVYAGHCTQIIDGRRVEMSAGDICLLDTNVPHSIEYLNESDIVITIEMRKELTDEWKARGIDSSRDYAILTNEMTRAWSGMSVQEYKALKRLKKENLRDNMTNIELVLNMLAEVTTTAISKREQPETFNENKAVARRGGKVAKNARTDIEAQLGQPVISPLNATDKPALEVKTPEEDDGAK